MKARRTIPLLGLALALALGALWYATELLADTGGAGAALPANRGGPASAGPAAADADPLAPIEERREAPREAVQVVEDPAERRAARSWARRVPADSIWIRGRVEHPDGTPADEELWVVAEGARFGTEADAPRRYRSKVELDGTFRVAVSPATRLKGRLDLRGRYLYLAEPEWVVVSGGAPEEEVVLKPLLGGCVVATVLAPRAAALAGDALDGVEVRTDEGPFQGGDEQEAEPLEEGRFRLGGLSADRTWTIEALSPRFANGRVADVEVEAGAVRFVDVPLTLGVRLSGTVVGPLGAPVDGATVKAMKTREAQQRNPLFNMTLGAEETETVRGEFELLGVPPGDLTLVAEADGFLEHLFELGELGDGAERAGLVLRMDAGLAISGRVRWPDGEPAEGATVRLAQSTDFQNFELARVIGEIVTGGDGTFSFTGLEEGACDVAATAIHPDDRPDPSSRLSRLKAKRIPRWTARLVAVEPGTLGLEIVLREGDRVRGTVVDDRGKALDVFAITAYPRGSGLLSQSSLRPVRGRFDEADGSFSMEGLAPGVWELRVSAGGHADADPRTVEVPSPTAQAFVLPRAATVAGIVRDPSGEPISRAEIEVTHAGDKNVGVDADSEGAFSAGELTPGRIELRARAEGLAGSEPLLLDVGAGERRENLVLALRPGAVVHGELHADAQPRAGRTVQLRGPASRQATTDATGRFRFETLDPGDYTVSLEAPPPDGERRRDWWLLRMANQDREEVSVAVGASVHVVLGAPSPEAVEVRGRVLSGGEPVGDALVTVSAPEDGSQMAAGARADGGGRFALTLDAPGRWRFRVTRGNRGGGVPLDVDVPRTDVYTLDLELPETRVVGRVTGPDGAPLAGLRVTLTPADDGGGAGGGAGRARGGGGFFAQNQGSTDEAGDYVIPEVAPGEYVLRAGGTDGWGIREKGAAYGRQVLDVTVGEGEEDVRVDVRLQPEAVLSGRVVDAGGAGVRRAQIEVRDGAGHLLSSFGNVRSRSDGSFEYGGLSPGTVSVSARADGLASDPLEVGLQAGENGGVTLTIR